MAEVKFEGKSLNRSILTVTSLDFWIYGCKNSSLDSSIISYSENRDATYRFEAGKPLRIGVSYSKKDGPTHYSGNLYLAFIPQDGARYLVRYEGIDRKKFKVTVQQYGQSEEELKPVDYVTKPFAWDLCEI